MCRRSNHSKTIVTTRLIYKPDVFRTHYIEREKISTFHYLENYKGITLLNDKINKGICHKEKPIVTIALPWYVPFESQIDICFMFTLITLISLK